jgi:hypothetical protein
MPRGRCAAVAPLVTSLLLAFVCSVAGGLASLRAADLRLASSWLGEPVRVDGNDEEWRGKTVPVDRQRFSLGVVNDGRALYLCLTTRDRVLGTQIGRQGLIAWFDPASGNSKKHTFGIHFPIEPRFAAMREPSQRWPGADPGPSGQVTVGIYGPGKKAKDDAERVPMDMAGGIQAALQFRGEVLVYEMKIPLRGAGTAYVVPADPGGSIRLELETPEWRGPLPPSRGPVGIGVAAAAPNGRGVIGYPTVDATYLKPMDVKLLVGLSSGQ